MSLSLLQLSSLESELKRCVKRKKKADKLQDEYLDSLLDAVKELRAQISPIEVDSLISMMETHDMQSEQKDFSSALSKLGRVIDKALSIDLDHFLPQLDVSLPPSQINIIIAEHLFREGRIEIGEMFLRECGLDFPVEKRTPFRRLNEMLAALGTGDTEPALKFCEENHEALRKLESPLEFQLRSLTFTNLVLKGDVAGAVAYSRKFFHLYADTHIKDIKRTMACLAYAKDGLEKSPYADLVHTEGELCARLTRDVCGILGLATEPPIEIAVNAGVSALPALLKMASVMAGQAGDSLTSKDTLPAEVEVNQEFIYHSVFACPVSRYDMSHRLLTCSENKLLSLILLGCCRVDMCCVNHLLRKLQEDHKGGET